MVERDVLTEKIPNADLFICLFHTLHTFQREITTEKMTITAAQRVTVLEIITKYRMKPLMISFINSCRI